MEMCHLHNLQMKNKMRKYGIKRENKTAKKKKRKRDERKIKRQKKREEEKKMKK